MLKGLSPLLNADVLHALRAMGHGDDLIICFNTAGAARPDGMKPRGKQWVEHWRRAKPRPAACAGPLARNSEGP